MAKIENLVELSRVWLRTVVVLDCCARAAGSFPGLGNQWRPFIVISSWLRLTLLLLSD